MHLYGGNGKHSKKKPGERKPGQREEYDYDAGYGEDYDYEDYDYEPAPKGRAIAGTLGSDPQAEPKPGRSEPARRSRRDLGGHKGAPTAPSTAATAMTMRTTSTLPRTPISRARSSAGTSTAGAARS